jgi:DnaK suppressor protein
MKNQQLIKELEEKLIKEKEEIEASLKSFSRPDSTLKGDFNTQFPSFGERTSEQDENADEVEEYENKLPIEYRLELRLQDINLALEKIRKNTYGICEKCGKEIDLERLKVIPEAKNCLNCAE